MKNTKLSSERHLDADLSAEELSLIQGGQAFRHSFHDTTIIDIFGGGNPAPINPFPVGTGPTFPEPPPPVPVDSFPTFPESVLPYDLGVGGYGG